MFSKKKTKCGVCGCQIALAFRAPRIDLPAISEQHDADAEESVVQVH